MKVCLISPPTVTDFEDREMAESEAVRLVAEHAPIGVLSLAAVLEQRGITPHIADLNRFYYEYLRSDEDRRRGIDFCSFVARKFDSLSFDVFGFSSICSSYPLTIRIAGEVRRRHREAMIIFGGPQASVVDVQTLKAFPFVDVIVRGEAEETLPLLLGALSDVGRWKGIPAITFRLGDGIVRNPNSPVFLDLDSLPMPAFHLYPELKDCHYVPLELGRGCPFACEFCSTNDFFRRNFRLKSPSRVIEQMRLVKQVYGIDAFDLIHDMFTVDRKRVVAFCEALLESGEKFYWGCSARTDCIDDELIGLMARAGCRGIFFGIETGSDRIQRQINKNLDLHEAASMIRCSDQHRIRTTVSLITGFPEETEEDLRKTVGFLIDSLRFDQAEPQLHLLAPLAETPIHAQYRGRLLLDDVFSDMSFQGWRQDPEDREMIESHPEIFPNFYAVPTPWLDRRRLKELIDFILNAIGRFRWLLVALHQDSGDLLRVFDEWRAWRLEETESQFVCDADSSLYYTSIEFRGHFLEFVRSRYLGHPGRGSLAVSTLLEYENALSDAGEGSIFGSQATATETAQGQRVLDPDMVFRLAKGLHVAQVGADYQRIIRCLRRRGRLDRITARSVVLAARKSDGKEPEVLQLSALSAQLLYLCDGRQTVREIAGRFSSHGDDIEGIPREKACLFGLDQLRRDGLIVVSSERD